MAEALLVDSRRREDRAARRRRDRLGRLLADPAGRRFVLALTDEVVRIRDRRRAARRFADLAVPASVGPVDRVLLRAGQGLARLAPGAVMPLVEARLRHESAAVILPAEDRPLTRHLARRRAAGVRVNVNLLGEAVLGDAEAARRLRAVQAMVARPDVDHVSVKISALCAQLDVLPFDHEVARLAVPLRALYRSAGTHTFVNLDMEAYDDLALTTTVFRRVLDEPELAGLDAGIVLQAYLPDSVAALEELAAWAATRHARAGGRVRVRLVKGANLAMEQVQAELHGWPQAPYLTKAEVDANLKRLLEVALDPRWSPALRVGLGSHNLLDVAWALVQDDERVGLEMLEGMAEGEARAVRAAAGDLLLYAPVVAHDDFDAAIAYLVRRLDENTGPENFLRARFDLEPGSAAWVGQVDRFRRAVAERHAAPATPRRTQDRSTERRAFGHGFANEPDTDWSLAANRAWLATVLSRPYEPAPLDPVDRAAVDAAVATARSARTDVDRRALLHRVAEALAAARGPLLHVMAHEAGKTVREADPEVSEAVDFANWYATSIDTVAAVEADGCRFEPYRVVVVASPWNFPLAIAAGGVLAALAAGSAVLLKPAPETPQTARLLAERCWAAGVPRDLLQLVPAPDGDVGRHLVTHPGVDAVLLTGAWETARRFLDWKPDLRLHAETSGKNAIVVTAAADLDLAVADLVRSAFGHAGQKCSAASLGILEASVYDDERFRRTLADAVRSLVVGAATDLSTRMGPLIAPAAGPLLRALTTLERGESWLVEPEQLDGRTWRPGVKLGVRPGSFFHLTECFGPVLGLLRAESLDHALELQHAPPYGLTGGLHSLDPAEIRHWLDRVEVGNAYVNRPVTGAVVRRQPFGGWRRSSVGPTAKAGGPNHVLTLGRWTGPLAGAEASFARWWAEEYAGEHDPSGLRAEANVLRYRPYPNGVLLWVGEGVPDAAVATARLAARTVGTAVAVVRDLDGVDPARFDKVRVLGVGPDELRRAPVAVDDNPVVGHGRIELLRWVREQAVSETRHRYGNVVADPDVSVLPTSR